MNQPVYQYRPRRTGGIPDVVLFLLVANGLIFSAQMLTLYPGLSLGWVDIHFSLWPIFEGRFAGWPTGVPHPEFHVWQLLTYGFLHGSLVHIAFNMFVLWMFGRELEMVMGSRRFLTYYLVCVVGAGVVQLIVTQFAFDPRPTVGASGGVYGLLLAFGMTFPNRIIMPIFPPIPMPAKYFVIVIGVFELSIGLSGRSPGVANFAHLGGMFFGYLLLRYWRRPRRR